VQASNLVNPFAPPFNGPQERTMLAMQPTMPLRDEGEWRQELTDLRREVAQMRSVIKDAASVEALMQERSGRELGENATRHLSAQIEETLARETTTLRADNADLRASLTESLRLLAEERRERQADTAEANKRLKDLQNFTEDRTTRLESLARGSEQRLNESRAALQEADKLREVSEYKALNAVAKEARTSEASLQREQQSRESMCADLEARWRGLLNEEKQMRAKETDALAVQLSRCEDAIVSEREVQSTRTAEVAARLEDVARTLQEEVRSRQVEFQQMVTQVEELRGSLHNEVRDRQDADDMILKRIMVNEGALEQHTDRICSIEKELMVLKQSTLDLRGVAQAEATTREEATGRLQNLLDNEIRAREQSCQSLAARNDDSVARLEQFTRTVVAEERALREDDDSQLGARVVAVTEELNFEKARATSQDRELAQGIQVVREALQDETASRRQEIALAVKGLDELREGLAELSVARERGEARLSEQTSALDAALRDECLTREAAERKALTERAELQDGVLRLDRLLEELRSSTARRLDEERRAREEADVEQQAREEAASKIMLKLQSMIKDEQESREQGQTALQNRVLAGEQALGAERCDREDRDRSIAARLSETSEDLAELRAGVRESLQRCQDLALLREALLEEKAERQNEEAALEAALKDQQVRLEQLTQAREQLDRRLDSRVADLFEKIDIECRDRASGDQECLKRLAEEHADRCESLAAERRRTDETICRCEKALTDKIREEAGIRENSVNCLEAKDVELREAIDGVRKWRVEQYNELVFELSKVTEMLSEEAKSRQQQDQVLANEVSRLREEAVEESTGRKVADRSIQEEVREVLQRLERESENWLSQERERWRAIEELRDLATAETSRREAVDGDLRQLVNKEVLTREEALAAAMRAFQLANVQTNEDWRAALRNEASVREESTVRTDQQIVEVRSAIQDTRAVVEQREEETRQRFKATAEALSSEEDARRSEDEVLQKVLEEHRQALVSERNERSSGEHAIAERFLFFEGQLREEAAQREGGERRTAKDILELQSRLQAEQACREDSDVKLDQRIHSEVAMREEACLRETKQREEADQAVLEAWRRGLTEEQALREEDRRDTISKLQQMQRDQQQEHEERMRADRELSAGLSRLQTLEKEEEETRTEHCERLGAAIERLQDELRATGPLREEVLRKATEYTDQVRGVLNKEILARSAKVDALDEAVREVRMRVGDEVQARESAVRAVADAIIEERTQREEGQIRERHLAEEEIQRTLQAVRKARDEDERRIADRLLELSGAISEERDLRGEALRCERQKLLDVKEELVREQKALERELSKQSQALSVTMDEQVRRTKEVDSTLGNIAERCDATRAELAAEVLKRETEVRNLDQRAVEFTNMLAAEAKERRDMDLNLRRNIEEESNLRETAFAADRRARLENKSFAIAGVPVTAADSAIVAADLTSMERNTRSAIGEMQDRLVQAEMRQKSAEERTVSMLDAIMSGLAGPGH
jgi:hypothetical protein